MIQTILILRIRIVLISELDRTNIALVILIYSIRAREVRMISILSSISMMKMKLV